MKIVSLFPLFFLLVVSATSLTAGPREEGDKLQHRWMMSDSLLFSLNLTEKQIEEIRILRESFQKSIPPFLIQIFEKRAELRLLWMQIKLDPVRIKVLEKEIHTLEGQLNEKSTNYRLAFRNILTPEQSAKFIALVGTRDHHHPPGRGGGLGAFPMPMPPPRW